MIKSLLHEELVFLNYEGGDQENLLRKFSQVMFQQGYVKDSYATAIIDREKEFPTGLNTPGIKIAMPHTYPEHVLKSAILVATLQKPVCFHEMGNDKNMVDVQMLFMLAVTDPKGHLNILSKLLSIFSNEAQLSDVYHAKDKKALIEKLNNILL